MAMIFNWNDRACCEPVDGVHNSYAIVFVNGKFRHTRLGTSEVSTDGESLELHKGDLYIY